MNILHVEIKAIQNRDNLNIIEFDFQGVQLAMMSLELDERLQIASKVNIAFKSIAVGLAKDLQGVLSYSNQLTCKIKSITKGELLSEITLTFFDTEIDSIITTRNIERMQLKVDDEVTALVKASDIYIEEIF